GLCDAERVRELYGLAAVFVLPSVTASDGDMEGQGLVLQEAQYCGIPVVSTLHNGIPDGVRDGITGFLVPEKNPELLAEKIIYLFSNEEFAARMGVEGRSFVASRYGVSILSAEMKGWYEELLR
ncbi:MAG TPA: glycosyltransferase, partial [Treponemataceae bacterium]|nr:glycosyltransferase [Treponemataceae bacterium]